MKQNKSTEELSKHINDTSIKLNSFINKINEIEKNSEYNLKQVLKQFIEIQKKELEKSDELKNRADKISLEIILLEEKIKINNQSRINNEKISKEYLGEKMVLAKLEAELDIVEKSEKLKKQMKGKLETKDIEKESDKAIKKAIVKAEKSVIEAEKESIKKKKKRK